MPDAAGNRGLVAGFDAGNTGRITYPDGVIYEYDASLLKGASVMAPTGETWYVATAAAPPGAYPSGLGVTAGIAIIPVDLPDNTTDTVTGTRARFIGWDISYLRTAAADIVELRLKQWTGDKAAAPTVLQALTATQLVTTGAWADYVATLGAPDVLDPANAYWIEVILNANAVVTEAQIGRIRWQIEKFQVE